MTVPRDPILDDAVACSFEHMAFAEALPSDPLEPDALGAHVVSAQIRIRPIGVNMLVVLPVAFAQSIASQLLGAAAIDEPALLDNVAELLNTIAGRWGKEALPAGSLESVGPPVAQLGWPPSQPDIEWSWFDVDAAPVVVGIQRAAG